MLPSPLHPAIVHFPIVLMFLLPLGAIGALWAIGRGRAVLRSWAFPATIAAALTVSAWGAVESGQADEERVEDSVGEQALHAHEAAGERFLLLSGGVLILTAAGLLRGGIGRTARALGTIAALGLIIAGYQVGHSGGGLVYGDGTSRGLAGAAAIDGATSGDQGSAGARERDE